MKNHNFWAAILLIALVAGCGQKQQHQMTGPLELLRNTEVKGDPYSRFLAADYYSMAKESAKNKAQIDFFARKGLRAAGGEHVPPENLSDWNVPFDDLPELGNAVSQLRHLLEMNAKPQMPQMLAHMQSTYDCWVAGLSENWPDALQCRNQFYGVKEAIFQNLDVAPYAHKHQQK